MLPATTPSSVGHRSMPGVLPSLTFVALTLQVLESATNRHEDLFPVGLESAAESPLFNFILGFGYDRDELDRDEGAEVILPGLHGI